MMDTESPVGEVTPVLAAPLVPDQGVLDELRDWANAIERVRTMGLAIPPFDPSRYWHYFGFTD